MPVEWMMHSVGGAMFDRSPGTPTIDPGYSPLPTSPASPNSPASSSDQSTKRRVHVPVASRGARRGVRRRRVGHQQHSGQSRAAGVVVRPLERRRGGAGSDDRSADVAGGPARARSLAVGRPLGDCGLCGRSGRLPAGRRPAGDAPGVRRPAGRWWLGVPRLSRGGAHPARHRAAGRACLPRRTPRPSVVLSFRISPIGADPK